jgi:hypothetical protein
LFFRFFEADPGFKTAIVMDFTAIQSHTVNKLSLPPVVELLAKKPYPAAI